jgi:hypothetical protein
LVPKLATFGLEAWNVTSHAWISSGDVTFGVWPPFSVWRQVLPPSVVYTPRVRDSEVGADARMGASGNPLRRVL